MGKNYRFSLQTETSRQLGASVGLRGGMVLTDTLVFGGGAHMGGRGNEIFLNLGWRFTDAQRLLFTAGQLRQKLEFDFPSGRDRAGMTQNSVGASWRLDLGGGTLEHAEFAAYTARTASHDLTDKTWSIDTATLFELWNDPRRVAGGQLDGFSGKLGARPWDGARLEAGLGVERLRYKLLAGDETHRRPTASLGLEQALTANTRLKANVDAGAAQTRYGLGLDWRLGGGLLGVQYFDIRGRDRAPNDSRVTLSWTLPLGGRASLAPAFLPASASAPGAASAPQAARSPVSASLLDQVATRPGWMPMQVIAKRDTTAAPTRLVVVDKTALPAGASVDPATGNVTAPLGVAVTGIAGVTLNAAPFVNTGQFVAAGSSLTINTTLIAQPTVGATDVYVVTLNNAGGGTTNVTINVQRGSVKIVSIVVAAGGADTTPDAFTFTDVTNQTTSTVVESNAITVAGINAAAAISVTGGEYQIDGGAWTSSAGTVTVGQTVKVRHTTSASNSTATNTVLTIGGVSDTFTTTTASGEVPPVMGDVPNQTGQVNTSFSLGLSAYVTQTNGDAILGYAIASGGLPPGLGLNTTTGVISGTPTVAGTYNVTVLAYDNDGNSNTDSISFVISANVAPVIVSNGLLGGLVEFQGLNYTSSTTIQISDTGNMTVQLLSDEGGKFTITNANGGTVSGNGTASVTITGVPSGTIGLNYTSPSVYQTGADVLTLTVTDSGGLATSQASSYWY